MKLRKIVVNGNNYFWDFSQKYEVGLWKSRLAIRAENRRLTMIIKFVTRDVYTSGNPINVGLPMIKHDEVSVVNLNRPKHVADFLIYLNQQNLLPYQAGVYEFDGNQLLIQMGYKDTDHYLMNS